MNRSQRMLSQAVQTSGLALLFFGYITAFAVAGAAPKPNQIPPSSSPVAKPSISEADADAIELWLMGDLTDVHYGISSIFSQREEIVLARPNAELELSRIVSRQDIPLRLRIYAQEMLITANRPADPRLAEIYCQVMQNLEGKLYHDSWGLPGNGANKFGRTLISYGQAALPCLSRILDDNSKLEYTSSESRAISNMYMYYRKSDLAAYLITQILNIPYNDDPSPVIRDRQIRELRQRLVASPNS